MTKCFPISDNLKKSAVFGDLFGDLINLSDPFGLCPPKDNVNCSTGDKNLDDPNKRQQIEDSYNNAPTDGLGYKREVAGECDANGCQTKVGSRDESSIPVGSNTDYEWHTHPNVGRPIPDRPGDTYTHGISPQDDFAFQVQRFAGFKGPSYIVDDKYVIKVVPGSKPQTFPRFIQP